MNTSLKPAFTFVSAKFRKIHPQFFFLHTITVFARMFDAIVAHFAGKCKRKLEKQRRAIARRCLKFQSLLLNMSATSLMVTNAFGSMERMIVRILEIWKRFTTK